ncbi:MAG: sel1 repeat family protein [Sphingobium sp.]
MTRLVDGLILLGAAIVATLLWTGAPAAARSQAEEIVLHCRIEAQDRVASISLDGTRAIYRFGRPRQQAELTLSSPLADLDYRREDGAGGTFDEIATFVNGDTAYRFAAGFKNGAQPDPSALRPFGTLTVSRAGKALAKLSCVPASIERNPDRLLARMRDAGRDRTSDGVAFPNYPIDPPIRAADAPACKAENNVDTCWSHGVGAARRGDLRGALEHYDKSCDARIGTMGCYEAGKLYLHNRQLRNYARAKDRLARTCAGDDFGQGPYACTYLGWMSFTGTGMPRNLDEAFGKLAKACFFHNDAILIDPEGCHFLGKTALELRGRSQRDAARADHLAYIAFAQGCTDNAKTVCDEARALYRREAARAAAWINLCDSDVGEHGAIGSCAELTVSGEDYDAAQNARRQLASMFRAVWTSAE